MATMNISLPDALRVAIEHRVEQGLFANSSDYIRDLVRRDLEMDKLQKLNAAIDVSLVSGPPKPFNGEALLEKINAQHL